MKTRIMAFFILLLFITSCEKMDNQLGDSINYLIDNISNIGKFEYDGDRLIKLGNEEIMYDDNGISSASRIYYATDTITTYNSLWGGYYDSIYTYHIEKFSYIWLDLNTLIKVTDTLIHKEYDKGLSPLINTRKINSDTSYFWFNDLGYVDSIVSYKASLKYWTPYCPGDGSNIVDKIPTSVVYDYDSKMNIIKSKTYSGNTSINIKEYQYDNNPNPYNGIFKTVGGLPEKTTGANISVNNPIKYTLYDYFISDIPVSQIVDIKYEYNSNGLPVEIYSQMDTVRIKYK